MTNNNSKTTLPRRYSANDVLGIVDLCSKDPEMDPKELYGMDKLAGMLKQFENMTDGEMGKEIERLL